MTKKKSKLIRKWAGFNKETWNRVDDAVKERFAEVYDKAN